MAVLFGHLLGLAGRIDAWLGSWRQTEVYGSTALIVGAPAALRRRPRQPRQDGRSRACAARGLTWRWAGVVAAAWGSVLLFAAVTLPLKYPHELRGQVVDTALVVGLTVPVAAMARTLDEGALWLVATASRPLARARTAWAAGMIAVTALLAGLLASVLAVPAGLLVADAVLFAGLALLGAAVLGGDVAWVPPLLVAATASAPGLLPLPSNPLYHHGLAATTLLAAIAAAAVGTLVYARGGPAGPASGAGLAGRRGRPRVSGQLTKRIVSG